jgi:hypothetical protein
MIMMAFVILTGSRILVVLESLVAWAQEGTAAPCRDETKLFYRVGMSEKPRLRGG